MLDIGTPSNEQISRAWHFDNPDCDGIDNVHDNCPAHSNPDQVDQDGDGVGDACDNCKTTYNPTQEDDDEDQIGNACDDDEGSPPGAPGFELLLVTMSILFVVVLRRNKI